MLLHSYRFYRDAVVQQVLSRLDFLYLELVPFFKLIMRLFSVVAAGFQLICISQVSVTT